MNNDFNDRDRQQNRQSPFGGGGRPQGSGCWMSLLWLVILAIAIPWLYSSFFGAGASNVPISYTAFHQQVTSGNVQSVTISGNQITGTLKKQATTTVQGQTTQYTDFVTNVPSFGDNQLLPLLEQNKVVVNVQPQSNFSWLVILSYLLPIILLVGIGYYFMRSMQSRGSNVFSMGRSRAKLYDRRKEGITFEDVAGAHGAKRELEEIVSYLKDPTRFQRLGGEIPKGVLLVGPPGTGKTMLARAVAGEADAPFFSITGSDFMEMFVGVGASRVRDLFNDAKKAAPSIIFIDELDSIGRRRGAGVGGGNDEREQTLNQLLAELDGFEPNQNVIVMAATNRPDILDPALLRPGRFDRRVTVDLPTMSDRLEILKIHARNKPLSADVDLEAVARGTPGFSGADLANLLNEAALTAARKGENEIHDEDINDARDKVLLGLERDSLAITDEECELLAYHEAGHAVVAAILPNADPIHKVTIVPRGRAMGVTQQLPERDRYLYPRSYMVDRLAVMMGGRAAEELAMNTSTSGAESDLKEAAKLARRMVLDWGMSESLKNVALGSENEQVFLGEDLGERRHYSETTAREVDKEVVRILDDAYDRARNTLQEHREGLDRVVKALLDKEEIPGKEVLRLLGIHDKEKEEEVTGEQLVKPDIKE